MDLLFEVSHSPGFERIYCRSNEAAMKERQISISLGVGLLMEIFAVLSLYIVFAFILGILAFVLKKKHTKFPDFRVGYHDKRAMENKEKWEHTNHTAGNLCAFFAAISVVACALLYFLKATMEAMLILFFVLAILAILSILIFPIQISKKSDRF